MSIRFKTMAAMLTIAILVCVTVALGKEPSINGDRLVFELTDLHGKVVKSSDDLFSGKVLLVTLWGTWCPPCVSEIPTFNDLQTRYAKDGLVVVAIAFERGTAADVRQDQLRRFVQAHNIIYLVLDGGLTSEFSKALPMVKDAEGLPVEMMIDRSGLVIDCRNGYGYNKKWARRLEERLKVLLEENH